MGNNLATQCCIGLSVVTVVRPNGRIQEFSVPIRASELMERYPEHLVIHSTYLERDLSFNEQRRKMTVLSPEDKLLPGHDYILYNIPPQYREAVAQCFAQSSLLNAEEKQVRKRMIKRRLQALASTGQRLATILQSTQHSTASDKGCEEDGEGNELQPLMAGNGKKDEDFSFYCGASWKPSLHSIPEAHDNARYSLRTSARSEQW